MNSYGIKSPFPIIHAVAYPETSHEFSRILYCFKIALPEYIFPDKIIVLTTDYFENTRLKFICDNRRKYLLAMKHIELLHKKCLRKQTKFLLIIDLEH